MLTVNVYHKALPPNYANASWLGADGRYRREKIWTGIVGAICSLNMCWFVRNDKLYLARYDDAGVYDLYKLHEGWLHMISADGLMLPGQMETIAGLRDETMADYNDNINIKWWDTYCGNILQILQISFADPETDAWTSSISHNPHQTYDRIFEFDSYTGILYAIISYMGTATPIVKQNGIIHDVQWVLDEFECDQYPGIRGARLEAISNGIALLVIEPSYDKRAILLYDIHCACVVATYVIDNAHIQAVGFLTNTTIIAKIHRANTDLSSSIGYIIINTVDGSCYDI